MSQAAVGRGRRRWTNSRVCFAAISLLLTSLVCADLPQELDPFLERLFETTECESFLSEGTLLAVATRDCPPAVCDFPRQLCMRVSERYKDESANQCIALPEQCLIAANGGKPIAPASPAPPSPIAITQSPSPPPPPVEPSSQTTPAVVPKPAPRRGSGGAHVPICEQGPPEGRFCGFSLKFAFNRETRSCDQFWFPGCRTERTNENLFDTLGECLEAAKHCARGEPLFRPEAAHIPVNPDPQPIPANGNSGGWGGGGGGDGGGGLGGGLLGQWQNGQAGQFIRMITNTIREVRNGAGAAQGTAAGQTGGGQGGFRFDPSQLGGLLQSFGRKKR